MFRAKTVLILGAGASYEVGLPLGTQLLSQITASLKFKFEHSTYPVSGDTTLFEALRIVVDEGREVEKTNEYLAAARHLSAAASQAKSIDAVIDALEDEKVEIVGKLAIVREILEAERKSNFFFEISKFPGSLNIEKFAETWFAKFAEILFEGRKKGDVGSIFNNLEIINFNYDRTLETFLLHSIVHFYGLPSQEIEPLVAALPLHRPYGIVAKLPWMRAGEHAVSFGSGLPADIARAYAGIRTFTERVDEREKVAAMQNAIKQADRIAFLGFGYHRQNLELIEAPTLPNCDVIGTSLGLSFDETRLISEDIRAHFQMDERRRRTHLTLQDSACADFFDEFKRRLSSGPRTVDRD